MSDTFSVKITATDNASPAFRSIALEAKKADSVLDSMGSGASKSLQTIERSSDEAAASVKKFGTATKDAESSTKGFGDGLTKLGAGAGAALSALSLLGQASVSQQQSIASLKRSYGEASDEILAFTERIQDSTRFSNDSARDAASLAATLANQYGLSTAQVEQLLTRTADLAQQFGLTFEDAAMRTTSAIRGEAESAELLNLSLSQSVVSAYAAQQGVTNYSSGLDQAGQAQLRLQLLLDQSASSQGAAGEAAEMAAGQAQQFVNSLQDGAQALGGFLGPAAQMASVLAPSVLALPLVGAGLGQVATAAKTAGASLAAVRLGGLALGAIAGPIGLIVGAAALAGTALYAYMNRTDEVAESQEAAATSVDTLTESIRKQAAAGNDVSYQNSALARFQETTGAAVALQAQLDSLATGYNANPFLLDTPNEQAGAVRGRQLLEDRRDLARFSQEQVESATTLLDQITSYQGANAAEVRANLDLIFDVFAQNPDADFLLTALTGLNTNLTTIGLTTRNAAGDVVALRSANDILAESYERLTANIETYNSLSSNTATTDEQTSRNRIAQARNLEAQAVQLRAQGRDQDALLAEQEARDVRNLNRAEETDRQLAQNDQEALARRQEVLDGRASQNEQDRAYGEELNANRRAQAEEERAIGEARVTSAMAVTAAYRDALGQTSDAPLLEGLDEMVAVGDISEEQTVRIRSAFDALEAGGYRTLSVLVAYQDVMGSSISTTLNFANALENAVANTQGLLGIYDAVDALGQVLSKADSIASDLFGGDVTDGLGPLVDLLNEGRISQEQFNATVEAGVQIQADNARGQAALNEVRADQLPLLADQTTELANYYEMLSELGPEEQQRALYLQDSANQQQVLTLANAAYAASIGEIPPEVVTTLIADAANADPILKGVLEDMNLIDVNDVTGEITVNFPNGESLPATITSLNGTLQDLGSLLAEIAGVPDPFGDILANAQALAGTDFSNLDGIGSLIGAFGGGRGRAGDGIAGYNPGGNGIGQYIPGYRPEHGQTNATPPGAFPPTPTPYGPNNPPPNIPATPLPQGGTANTRISMVVTLDDEATGPLNRLSDLAQSLDGRQAVLDALANDEASPKLAAVGDLFDGFDGKSANLLLDADDQASGKAFDAGSAFDGVNGKSATLYALGDDASAVGAAAVAGASFDGVNGKSALLFALGDSSGAENAAAVGAGAIFGIDGTTGYVYAEGVDNYSGVINSAKSLDGVVLSTSYVDTYIREFKQSGISKYFANGGVVGYADGGVLPTAALGRVLVGENGPEIATLPGGTLVTPSPASQAIARDMRGGGGVTNTFNLNGTFIGMDDIVGELAAALDQSLAMQMASMGGGR